MKTARQYRERAVFLRKIADEAQSELLRDSYLKLARDWEDRADIIANLYAVNDGKGRSDGN